MSSFYTKLCPMFLCLLVLLPSLVVGERTCDSEESGERNKPEALKYKLVALASILVFGGIGVCIPMLGKFVTWLNPENNLFYIIKVFAAGVILSTSCVHILLDSFENLTSPCLNEIWGKFPWTGFVMMVAVILVLIIESFLPVAAAADANQLLRDRVLAQVLELGIVVHSVIIGISLGASQSPDTIKPLVIALTFHQFFEGMGLAGCISQGKFKACNMVIMALFFALTTPIGIAIGIGISDSYDENSPKALAVEGILNATSAGILIYMALVDLLAPRFRELKVRSSGRLQLGSILSVLFVAIQHLNVDSTEEGATDIEHDTQASNSNWVVACSFSQCQTSSGCCKKKIIMHLFFLQLEVKMKRRGDDTKYVAKMLLYGGTFGCLSPILSISAFISDKSPFVYPKDEEHYKYLKAKSFFPKLIEYITSGPIAWEVVGGVASARKLIGATNPLPAEPGTIRGMLYMEVTALKMGNVK
ncbi:hypothetical protein ACFE04_019537 [Oxalis oulophora]